MNGRALLIWISLGVALLAGCKPAATPTPEGLPQLLQASAPCRVPLQPAWTGQSRTTMRTGPYTNEARRQVATAEGELRFDWFTYSGKTAAARDGVRTLSRGEGGDRQSAVHTYRNALPGDAQIAGARTVSALEKLLGPPQGFADASGTESGMQWTAGWALFTIRDQATVETISVSCAVSSRRGEREARVEGLRITRGIAKPNKG